MAGSLLKLSMCIIIVLAAILESIDAHGHSRCFKSSIYAPICGSDGVDYDNLFSIMCQQTKDPSLEIKHRGTCDGKPYKIVFRAPKAFNLLKLKTKPIKTTTISIIP